MKNKLKQHKLGRPLLTACAVLMLFTGSMQTCFAAETVSTSPDVPLQMSLPVTAIDATVTERIMMNAASNASELAIDPLTVTNNGAAGVLLLDSVAADGINGWTIIAAETDFANMPADTREYSMIADQSFDMSTDVYRAGREIDPKSTAEVKFSGEVGVFTAAVAEEHAANVVATISMKAEEVRVRGYVNIRMIYDYDDGHYTIDSVHSVEGTSWRDWLQNGTVYEGYNFYIDEENNVCFYPDKVYGDTRRHFRLDNVKADDVPSVCDNWETENMEKAHAIYPTTDITEERTAGQ